MKSKAEIIGDNLAGCRVMDIGGSGYEEDNAYEAELAQAWSCVKERVCVDYSPHADISLNLNEFPIKACEETFDVATAFDVLEHLEHPVEVLRWIPADRLLVTLPNAKSFVARRMEETNQSKHLYSFTHYTAGILLGEAGWKVDRLEYQFGKWSVLCRILNCIGSLAPSWIGTGIVLHCHRSEKTQPWKLR